MIKVRQIIMAKVKFCSITIIRAIILIRVISTHRVKIRPIEFES